MDALLNAQPMNVGWSVSWFTGEVRPRTRKMKDGSRKVIGEIRMHGDFYTTSREAAEQKAAELIENGYEEVKIGRCMF